MYITAVYMCTHVILIVNRVIETRVGVTLSLNRETDWPARGRRRPHPTFARFDRTDVSYRPECTHSGGEGG